MRLGTLAFPFSVVILTLLKQAAPQHPCDGITGTYRNWIRNAQRRKVVVVGGGVAGLEATRQLLRKGLTNVLLLEAQDYVGGRVKTYREDGPIGQILVEDGAEWINGGQENFLYGVAQNLNGLTQPLPDRAYDWQVRTSNGTEGDPSGWDVAAAIYERCERDAVLANYQNTGYGQCYIDSFQTMYNALPAEREAWFHYLHMWVNKDTGTNTWTDQSGRDADHFTDWGLDQWNQWSDGYDTLVRHINSSIPNHKIRTSSPVCKIFWRVPKKRVLLVTADREAFLADQTIVTASIGHLKDRHSQLFSPALPWSYRRNFNRIELGIADKVQIGWDQPWWASNAPLVINVIFPVENLSEEESWLYGVMEFMSVHQYDNILQAFVTGDSARHMESLPEDTVKRHVVDHLSRLMNITVPTPAFFRRSQWFLDPWMRGSYNSYVTVNGDSQGLKSRRPFLRPISNRRKKVIFFAGEHTHTYRYGTVDGAMRTGTWAANAVYRYR